MGIREVLMNRDGYSAKEAEELIDEAREQLQVYLQEGDSRAHDICAEYFGLEPDYVMELL